jgi:hypothetical protein
MNSIFPLCSARRKWLPSMYFSFKIDVFREISHFDISNERVYSFALTCLLYVARPLCLCTFSFNFPWVSPFQGNSFHVTYMLSVAKCHTESIFNEAWYKTRITNTAHAQSGTSAHGDALYVATLGPQTAGAYQRTRACGSARVVSEAHHGVKGQNCKK